MRKIKKDFNSPPAILSKQLCLAQIKEIIEKRKGDLATYYSKEPVVIELKKLYKGKCAYCETKIEPGASPQVEHYRPKASVDHKDLVAGQSHEGYYWLANEWTNLLISCPKCNQKSYKGTRFPLQLPSNRITVHPQLLQNGSIDFDAHQINSATLSAEQPLLINPEIDDPDDYFLLERDGSILPKNNAIKAVKSIEIYGLNREPLRLERQYLIDNFIDRINSQLLLFRKKTDQDTLDQIQEQLLLIFDELREGWSESAEYTFTFRQMVENFHQFIENDIENEFQAIIMRVFKMFLEKL